MINLSFGNQKSVGHFLNGWLDESVALVNRTATERAYRSQVRLNIAPIIGEQRLTKLGAADLHNLYVKLAAQGKAPATITQTHAVMHRALDHAVAMGVLPTNPAARLRPPCGPESHPNPLVHGEAARVVEASASSRYGPLWRTFLGTGLRFSEAAGLQWSAIGEARLEVTQQVVRHRGGWAFAEPKARRSRRGIPLPVAVVTALDGQRELLAGRPNQHDLVFPSKNGEPMWESTVLRALQSLLARLGIEPHTIHDLRDTYATTLSANGIDAVAIQDLLGHSSIQTTRDRYIGLVERHLADAVATLDL